MTHELHKPKPVELDQAKNDDDLKYVPVWLGEGKEKDLPRDRDGNIVKNGNEYRAVLDELGIEELEEDFDYTDYLASTGQIVFSEDDPRAQKYADNENYQAAANSRVADAFKGNAERELSLIHI